MAPLHSSSMSACSSPLLKDVIGDLDRHSYVALLTKLIGESEYVQNNPPKYKPKENRVARHVLDVLLPLSTTPNNGGGGGPLVVQHITNPKYPERGNVIAEYPGTGDGAVSFVGMHMDVVPVVNPKDWKFNPFSLSVDGDRLQGRGTTDCLGHVALVTELMKRLGETKPKLKNSIYAVFICNEENGEVTGIGVDMLAKEGYLDALKAGPLYWIDVADKQPCIGSGGMITWDLKAIGKQFHSGLPNKAINAMELNMEALKVIQTRFYSDVPPLPEEKKYKYATPSTMKPTQWTYPGGSVNQIPGECTISGDVRLTAFYSPTDIVKKLYAYVDDINAHIEDLDTRGPVSKYVLPDEGLKGSVEITFDEEIIGGIACNLDSRGYQVLYEATKEVIGYVEPYADTGTLPLVRDLQDEGFDVQLTGYGINDVYHADNEYCLFSDMKQGFEVFVSIISKLEEDK
ncbi:acetylornithine deacetylase-like isoform X3 [Ananas comosus]|uniref:Acetylornithine deacetylase-like isoform X3 n=1 Tax=Ananas comosus TaxID=4615 RepID=A0A6P5FMF2_ANACO|nr:acetylornithine deacetylase-like isoform X3 [Ananas comosus]